MLETKEYGRLVVALEVLRMISIVFIWSSLTHSPCAAVLALNEGSWKPFIPAEEDVQIFGGNRTSPNQFHRMHFEEDFALISARNMVYKVSLVSFTGITALVWNSDASDIQLCQLKQKTAEECQNYIRVIIQKGKDEHLVCGTNAFRPLCRIYSSKLLQNRRCSESSDSLIGNFYCEEAGTARCPYDPKHNSSAIYAGDRLFFATVADVSGRDSLIFGHPLRTEQHDSQWLNDPDFVSSYEFGDKVYFFFREMAVENINCGKAVFSRVARVCTDDRGGERVLRNTWTSFFKARLNCSIPGEFPFYFDEIQSTSELGHGNVFPTLISSDRVPMIYGVFTTPRNSLHGSAICAYRFSDIIATFEGPFKEQKTAHSNWLPVREADVPSPHPAKSCHNSTLSDQTLNFIKWHPLMDRAVPAFGGQPVIVHAGFNFSFTQVTVDWQVPAADHKFYDILFIGTDEGHVVKVINRGRGQRMETEVIEVLKVFPDGEAVTDIKIYTDAVTTKKLIILSDNEMRSLPLHRCHLKKTCCACIGLKDPYCSWLNNECVNSPFGLQSVETGRHAKCPQAHITDPVPTTEDDVLQTTLNARPRLLICPPCPCGSGATGNNEATFDNIFDETLEISSFETTTVPSAYTERVLLAAAVISTPEVVFQEVKGSEPCTKTSAVKYSSSDMALSVVLSVIFSLVIGLTFGYFVAVKRHSRIYKVKKQSLSSAHCRNEKNQNLYEIDDGTSHHSCNERCRALFSNGKQQSESRENNAANDFSHVDILDRRKNVAYL